MARRFVLVTLSSIVVASGLSVAGCDKKPASTAPSDTAPKSAAALMDWAKVQSAGALQSTEAMCRLCRLIDVRHKGRAPVTLTFVGSGATDGDGASYTITAAEWKGIADLAAKSPDGTTAGRALPAGAKNYADGLGPAPRHAYTVKRESESAMTFTAVKQLDDGSNG